MLLLLSVCSLLHFVGSTYLGFSQDVKGTDLLNKRLQFSIRIPYFNTDRFLLELIQDWNNIVLHLSVRLSTKWTVCNSRISSWWGFEQIEYTYFPFLIGKLYKIDQAKASDRCTKSLCNFNQVRRKTSRVYATEHMVGCRYRAYSMTVAPRNGGKLEIDVEEQHFLVHVNGLFFLKFQKRQKQLAQIKEIRITDLYVYSYELLPLVK